MKKTIILLTVFNLCFACSEKKGDLVFHKLVGTWKLKDGSQFERWIQNPDGTFTSRMFEVNGEDTTVTEEAIITSENNKWHFKTLVKGQNQGKPVTFSSSFVDDTSVQFENPAHDFPRIINYSLIDETSLTAFIAGSNDTIYFHFSKVGGGKK